MTDGTTQRLGLPFLQPGQAQKEMSHNEALVLLDALVQASAQAAGIDVPPDNPGLGACWIVGAAPTEDWVGQADALAAWTEGGWRFVPPREGMRVWIAESGGFAVYRDGGWVTGRVDGRLFVDGVQLVGPRAAAIADPAGGATVDSEARAAILAILERLRSHGLVEQG